MADRKHIEIWGENDMQVVGASSVYLQKVTDKEQNQQGQQTKKVSLTANMYMQSGMGILRKTGSGFPFQMKPERRWKSSGISGRNCRMR